MIKVRFKADAHAPLYDSKEFVYEDYENAGVGDIVVVNTRYGFAIAKVSAVNVIEEEYIDKKLQTVKTVLVSEAERLRQLVEKQKKEKELQILANKVAKVNLLEQLGKLLSVEDIAKIKDLSYEELKAFANKVNNL